MGGKAGYKTQILGIYYDKDGKIKRIDVQGMTLKEVMKELRKKLEAKKHGSNQLGDSK